MQPQFNIMHAKLEGGDISPQEASLPALGET